METKFTPGPWVVEKGSGNRRHSQGGEAMNNNLIPCGLEDDRCRFEPDNMDLARATEDYADNLMAECVRLAGARQINTAHDLYDGDFLPRLLTEIANWTGSPESSHLCMKSMHNMLANKLQKIAEREVSK